MAFVYICLIEFNYSKNGLETIGPSASLVSFKTEYFSRSNDI